MNKQHIKWKVISTTYVDRHTGEILTKYNAKRNYKKYKTIKNAYTKIKLYDPNGQHAYEGCIEYTIECERNPQTRLF